MEKRIRRSGTDYATPGNFLKHTYSVNAGDEHLEYTGLPLDWEGDGRYSTTKPEQHALIIGDTGCGKTRRLIIPSIKLIGKTGESMVISDPKGELYKKTAGALKKKGYEIRALNLRNPRNGDRWNPLMVVEKMYFSKDEDEKNKGLIMLEEIIDMMAQGVESGSDKYWASLGKQYIKAIAMTILDYGKKGDLTFSNIALLESEVTTLLQKRIEISSKGGDPRVVRDRNVELFMRFFNGLDENSPIRQNYQGVVCIAADKTFAGVASVAHTMASAYVRERAVQTLLSSSDFDITSLGERSVALYIILPDEIQTLYPLATMFVNQIYSILCDLAYKNGGMLKRKVNFILDEFANFARLDNIASMLTASRSRGMRFFLVCQDVDQLEKVYGRNGAAILRSNCQSWVFMGCRNTEFLKMLEMLAGTYVETYTGKSMPLVSMSDLEMLETGESFVFIKGCPVKYCTLPDYLDVDYGEGDVEDEAFPPQSRNKERKPVSFVSMMEDAIKKERAGDVSLSSLDRTRDALLFYAMRNIYLLNDNSLGYIDDIVSGRDKDEICTPIEAEAKIYLFKLILKTLFSPPKTFDDRNLDLSMRVRQDILSSWNSKERERRLRDAERSTLFEDFIKNRSDIERALEREDDERYIYSKEIEALEYALFEIKEQYEKYRNSGQEEFDFTYDEAAEDDDEELFGDEEYYNFDDEEKGPKKMTEQEKKDKENLIKLNGILHSFFKNRMRREDRKGRT